MDTFFVKKQIIMGAILLALLEFGAVLLKAVA